jgi:putative ABC transport system substrate-binding protein
LDAPPHPNPLPACGEGESRRARIRRREFITLLGGAAAALPFAARAQSQAMPVVGFLRSTPRAPFESLEAAFREGLKEAGFVEGQNVAIESRYGDNQRSRLPVLAAELVRLRVNVIVGNILAAAAAKAATTTIPIVFAAGSDPVHDGLVPNLNRPGGNVTGTTFFGVVVGTKRLSLLRQFVPKATLIAVLVNPNTAPTEAERSEILTAARSVGQQLIILDVRSAGDIERAYATAIERRAGAILIGGGAFMNSQRKRLADLAARHALPAIHIQREFAELGGLMSYGTSQTGAYHQAGVYAGRILKGEKPGNLPVVQATKFELVINLKTAKTLGLEFHPQLLATVDEVIE